jgi:hypothetical protein
MGADFTASKAALAAFTAALDADIAKVDAYIDELTKPPPPPVKDLAHLGSPGAWCYQPVPQGARFLPETHLATVDLRRDLTAAVNRASWGAPIVQATDQDPMRTVHGPNSYVTSVRIPDSAAPSAGSGTLAGDRHLVVVQPDGSIFEAWLAICRSSGDWDVGDFGWWPPLTDWVPGTRQYPWTNGMQAANVSIAICAYRPEHFAAGRVDTAISVILGNAQLGTGITSPATSGDRDYLTRNKGHVDYGARAVARGAFWDNAFMSDELAVARGLADHGIIVTDRSAAPVGSLPRTHFAVRMDPRCTVAQETAVRRVVNLAIPHLRIVDLAIPHLRIVEA